MNRRRVVLPIFALLAAGPAAAAGENHTVTFNVPVNISAMPYIKAFTVGCKLTYPAAVVLNSAQSGAAYSRFDRPLTGGEFHGAATITITAPEGPAPTGYSCEIYVTPADDSGAFQPVAPPASAPAQHLAAPGTPLVTVVTGKLETSSPVLMKAPVRELAPQARTLSPR